MSHAVNDEALDTIFRAARTYRKWQGKPVSTALLMAVYDLMRLGPTEGNICPVRIVFVMSDDAKARLMPLLDEGNRAKTQTAGATAIIGYDLNFTDKLGVLVPHNPKAADSFNDPAVREFSALRSAALQGGYFILAARALGLDCGPMGGFRREGVDKEFFAGTAVKSLFLCNLGYGDATGMRPRAPRLAFDEACKLI
jgi:3-hydroxypropanoate dehydrogenase